MEEPTIDERKRWWLLCYGVTAMDKVMRSCDLIAERCTGEDDPLFPPLAMTAHIYYARPFKRNRGVNSLPESIIPADHLGIHRWLINFRDSVMAHTDADTNEVAGRPMHDVVYSVAGPKRQFSTGDPRAPFSDYAHVRDHASAMRKIFWDELMTLHGRFGDLIPDEEGHHRLSIDPATGLFVGHTLPVNDTLTYK